LRSKIFWKFCGAYFLVISLFLLVSYFFLRSYLSAKFIDHAAHSLDQTLAIAKDALAVDPPARWDPQSVDPVVDKLFPGLEARITIVDPQGRVLGDSSVSEGALLDLENHGSRPEIQSALLKGYGQAMRFSNTLKMNMLYVARPFEHGTLRAALPLSWLDRSLDELKRLLVLSLVVGAFVALFLSFLLARRFSRSLQVMTAAASRMAEGDLTVRVPVKGSDEIARLSRSFNALSEKLSGLVHGLSDEKNQLRVILDSMIEGVMVLDSDQQILLTNRAIEEIFALEVDPEGHTPLELVRNPDLQEVVRETLSGKRSDEREIRIQRKGSKQIIVHASPLYGPEGIEGSVLVFHDITSLRRLEKVRQEFVANVSHELKTPLATVKGYTETLIQGALKDEANAMKFLQVIDRHTERLNQIIQDLLDLSKIESAEYELRLEKVPIAQLVEDLKTTFSKVLEEKKISFETNLQGVDFLWADPSALSQVLSNLLDNAIKYSNREGKIVLNAETVSKGVRFSVEDDGPGIPPEHLSRIFERFYRVDQSRSRDLGGTGLGLSIVKHLVQLHGGEVKVESQWGRGAKFYFILPQEGMI